MPIAIDKCIYGTYRYPTVLKNMGSVCFCSTQKDSLLFFIPFLTVIFAYLNDLFYVTNLLKYTMYLYMQSKYEVTYIVCACCI